MPPKRMLVHDANLSGRPPEIAENIYHVPVGTTTEHVCAWIGTHAARVGGLDQLIIMCHGYTFHEDERAQQTTLEAVGGAGLWLGEPGLTLQNVTLTQQWKSASPPHRPLIRTIYLYACAAAAGRDELAPEFDGRRFCGEMAAWSGAFVYGADKLQWYRRNWRGIINFGGWEGQVYRFSPVNGHPTPVHLGAQPMPLL